MVEDKKESEWQKLEQMVIDNQKTEEERSRTAAEEDLLYKSNQQHTLVINDLLLAQIENAGYPKGWLVNCLNNDELNYATAFYYLLCTDKEF